MRLSEISKSRKVVNDGLHVRDATAGDVTESEKFDHGRPRRRASKVLMNSLGQRVAYLEEGTSEKTAKARYQRPRIQYWRDDEWEQDRAAQKRRKLSKAGTNIREFPELPENIRNEVMVIPLSRQMLGEASSTGYASAPRAKREPMGMSEKQKLGALSLNALLLELFPAGFGVKR